MTKTLTRLFDSHTEALRAVDTLEGSGVDHDDISIISNNADNWHADHKHADGHSAGDLNHDGENDIADGAGKGAATGGALGAGAGLLAGLGVLAIPGLGPVVAAGWLASTALAAAVGAAAGGATGGLLGALKEAGHSDEDAHVYAEGVRRGGTLISVKADDEDAERIDALLNSNSGVDLRHRGEAYRTEGWRGFDADAQPYSADQIATERQRYAEERSFAGVGVVDVEGDLDAIGRTPGRDDVSPIRGL